MSWLKKLTAGLKKSSEKVTSSLSGISRLFGKEKIDAASIEEIEEALILADLGVSVASDIAQALRGHKFAGDVTPEALRLAQVLVQRNHRLAVRVDCTQRCVHVETFHLAHTVRESNLDSRAMRLGLGVTLLVQVRAPVHQRVRALCFAHFLLLGLRLRGLGLRLLQARLYRQPKHLVVVVLRQVNRLLLLLLWRRRHHCVSFKL